MRGLPGRETGNRKRSEGMSEGVGAKSIFGHWRSSSESKRKPILIKYAPIVVLYWGKTERQHVGSKNGALPLSKYGILEFPSCEHADQRSRLRRCLW
jgi:hypothetical protein